jgi:hypothetical protein
MLLNTWLISPTPHQVSDLLYLLTPGFGICHSVTPFSSNVRKNFFKRGQLLDCLCILILLLPFIHFLVNKWIATSTLLVHSHIHVCVCVWKLLIKTFFCFFPWKKCLMSRVSIKFITFYVDDGEKKKEKHESEIYLWIKKKMIICFISDLFNTYFRKGFQYCVGNSCCKDCQRVK